MGKHKKPESYGGSTSRGPARWARAASNALQRPNSQAGRLYLQRTSLAFQIAEEARKSPLSVDPDTPFEHRRLDYAKSDMRNGDYVAKREYATCSVFCAVMVAQLDEIEDGTLASVRNAFTKNFTTWRGGTWEDTGVMKIVPLDRRTLTRTVRCYYCAGKIGQKKR